MQTSTVPKKKKNKKKNKKEAFFSRNGNNQETIIGYTILMAMNNTPDMRIYITTAHNTDQHVLT